jgi:antitoxin component HigA of HigAB toxin-antitoxin module
VAFLEIPSTPFYLQISKIMFQKSIISNETDYRLALAAIEPLLQKGFAQLTTGEDSELVRVTALIEIYESVNY